MTVPAMPRLDPELFRRQAHQVADWMADYLRDVSRYPVQPSVLPGEIRAQLPERPPAEAEEFSRIMADFERIIVPGMTHWGHPGFFGYFPANTSPPSILAEMLTAALGAQCMSWSTSPAATELEQVTLGWLRRMLGLPEGFTGVIQDTASTATLVAFITARDQALGRASGRAVGELTAYTSEEANFSVTKGARLAGFLPERIRLIETDAQAAMKVDALEATIAADRAAGLSPCCVVSTVGTTGSTAIDPVPAIAEVCRREKLWLHVDAAFAGSAAILPEMRWLLDGAEAADSLVVNPHKWLLVNFDCSAYFVRDPATLLRSFAASAEILKSVYDGTGVNFRDWGIQLGRRFRALKLWFVIRTYGVEGLQAMIREHIRLGHLFASWVEAEPGFELAGPARLATVCFRRVSGGNGPALDPDALNQDLLRRLNASGKVFLTGTRLKGRYVLRLSLGHLTTTEGNVREAWETIRQGA
ncbi:MAG TPA: pyridoxal-dependent decarboxylase [Gemmatimonadales bacterium]|nr:pyridoxal-dependent decarboxylase [Gemmatimonadales bacterium]